jgi:hypothetical protein
MLKSSAVLALIIASGASAQSISYVTNNPSLLKGDPNQVVCQREDKIGTRLGGEKVCHTVAEWNQIHEGNRENAERMQMGVRMRCGADPSGGCGGTQFSIGDLSRGNGAPTLGANGSPPR